MHTRRSAHLISLGPTASHRPELNGKFVFQSRAKAAKRLRSQASRSSKHQGRGAGGLEQGCRGCRKQVCRVPAAGFAGEVPGPELASKARNAELELAQRGQRQLSAQLGHLARLGQGPPGPPGPRAVPAAPNPHPHALPVGTVGTGPPANLSVNGLPPAHPFAYPFEGPKTKTVPGKHRLRASDHPDANAGNGG